MPETDLTPSTVVRTVFAVATVAFGLVGILHRWDARWLAASAVFGAIWTLWDVLISQVFGPLADWLAGGAVPPDDAPGATPRPSPDDVIRLLEAHLASATDRHGTIQTGLRLADLYRTVRHDPARAEEVLRSLQTKYPDAPELARAEPPPGQDSG